MFDSKPMKNIFYNNFVLRNKMLYTYSSASVNEDSADANGAASASPCCCLTKKMMIEL